MAVEFGLLDPIDKYLEKNRERLGPLHRPLYVLTGAAAFVLILAAILVLPALCLSSCTQVVFTQIGFLAVYFILLQAIRQNVFDRFAFCLVLYVVLAAAPNAIGVQLALDDFTPARSLPQLPFRDIFIYAVVRGLPCTLWTAPLLFYFFTFAPKVEKSGGDLVTLLKRSFWMGLGLHLVASLLTIWLSGMWQRFTASTAGAGPTVVREIGKFQTGFFVFSCLYLLVGFAGLFIARYACGAKPGRVQAVLISGLFLGQILFAITDYNVRALNSRYPAALTTGSAVEAYANPEKTEFVFVNSWYRQVAREATRDLMLYTACTHPTSGKFTYLIQAQTEFQAAYPHQYDLGLLAAEKPESRFCQPR